MGQVLVGRTMPEGPQYVGLPMPLPVAILVFVITIGFGGGYVGMKTWFYLLNARFRKNCAAAREQLAGEPILVFSLLVYWLIVSNAGGGGERVLWTAIKAIQETFPHVISIIYSGDTDVTPTQLLDNVQVIVLL